MKKRPWLAYVVWIALAEGVGLAAGLLIREDARIYADVVAKPPLSPPPWVFPAVWTVLYALMGVGAARVFLKESAPARTRGLVLFAVQLAFNFCWPLIFFRARAFAAAALWLAALLTLAGWMAAEFGRTDRPAGRIQLPYLLWLVFAEYLNLGVWLLNGM